MKEGGYDQKVNETVNVVSAKTSEIGQKTWGLMRGVMAMASQKVSEYTKDDSPWKNGGWPRNESNNSGSYQDYGNESKGWNSSQGQQSSSNCQFNSVSSGSWDDWDNDGRREPSRVTTSQNGGDGWAGWDDGKEDVYDNAYNSPSSHKREGQNGKSDTKWSEGGFL